MITTGLTADDFTFVLIDYLNRTDLSASEITAVEYPSASGYYVFSFSAGTSSYYFKATYNATTCEYYFPIGSSGSSISWVGSISLATKSNIWKKGDTKPALTLQVDDFVENPVGWTCTYDMVNTENASVKIDDSNCEYSYTDNGDGTYKLTITYNWSATDLNMNDINEKKNVGTYYGEFTLQKSTDIYTFPTDNSLKIIVMRKQ